MRNVETNDLNIILQHLCFILMGQSQDSQRV